MTIPPPPPGGGGGVRRSGPSEATVATGGSSAIVGSGGAMASRNSLGGSGFVILPNARWCGAGAARCLVLVSSALVRSPGDRSPIIERKLLAACTPGSAASTPMNAARDRGAARTIPSAPPTYRTRRRRCAAARCARRARPRAFRRLPERVEVATSVIQSPEKSRRARTRKAYATPRNH